MTDCDQQMVTCYIFGCFINNVIWLIITVASRMVGV